MIDLDSQFSGSPATTSWMEPSSHIPSSLEQWARYMTGDSMVYVDIFLRLGIQNERISMAKTTMFLYSWKYYSH